jgi:DNA-binding response OmpR family regulator
MTHHHHHHDVAGERARPVAPPARPSVLCIEDDRETAAVLCEDLTDRGFAVAVAQNGEEGLRAILKAPPDLVLCDISLPLMSGFDILERLSAIAPGFGRMPFVFLTAFTDRENELKGRRLGADDYVTKPIDFDVLEAIIRTRLARTPRADRWPQDPSLNDREIETLTWSARGKTSGEIALILGLSKRTVDFHIDNARAKLGATTRIEAAIKAASVRLIEP